MENLLYSIYQQTQCTKGKINIHSKHIINQNVYMKFTYLKKKKQQQQPMNSEIACVRDNGESLVHFLRLVTNLEYTSVYNLV